MTDKRLLCSLLTVVTFLRQGLAEICSGPTRTINLAPFEETWLKYPSNDSEQPYRKFQNCSWLVDAGVGYKVLLDLTKSECNDTLIVHGGSRRNLCILPDFMCGKMAFENTNQTVLITFITDGKTYPGEKGFEFRLMAVKDKGNDCTPTASVMRNATRTVDFITSPDFPVKYNGSLSCKWTVQSTELGEDVAMYFEYRYLAQEFDFEDKLSIDKKGARGLQKFFVSKIYEFYTMNKAAVVEFKSGSYRDYDIGFVLAYYIKEIDRCSETAPKRIVCENGGTCVNSTCLCADGFTGIYCELISVVVNISKTDIDVREGGKVLIEVEIADKNNLEYVSWTRNGVLISNSKRYNISTDNVSPGVYRNTLRINYVLERDAGLWKCTASNGATSSEGNITINVAPRVNLLLDPKFDFAMKEGSKLKLTCLVSNPKSLRWIEHGSLKWYKGNHEIKNDSNWLVRTTNNTSQLTRNQVQVAHEGVYSCNYSGSPESNTIYITVNVYKPETVSCKSITDEHGLQWNETPSNKRQESQCPKNLDGRASRLCKADGKWESTNLINCTEPVFVELSDQLDEVILDGVQDKEEIESILKNTILTVRNFTKKQDVLSAGDLSSSMSILEKTVIATERVKSPVEEKAFFHVVDTILSPNNSEVLNTVSKETKKDTSTVIKTIDRMTEVVIQDTNMTAITHVGESIELTINRTILDKSNIIFPEDTASKRKETYLKLPGQESSKTNETNYVVVIYKTVKNMVQVPSSPAITKDSKSKSTLDEKSEDGGEFINSQILSLSTQHNLGLLSPPLSLTFRHVEKHASKNGIPVCVSWNFSISKWSKYGCHVNSSTDEVTVCNCNHLTNFAILMKPNHKRSGDSEMLGIISIIGCAVSILFALLTFILFAVGWKFIKSDQNVLMMNLCVSIVISYTVFIVGVKATHNQVLCYAITAALHFFFLVTFFLMLGMGIYYFILVTVTYFAMHVTNNFKAKSRLQWFLIGAWGIPAVLAGVTIGIFWNNGYHMQKFCWLSVNSGSLYFFITPVLVIAVVNVLIIISLMRVMCRTSSMAKSSLNKKASSGLRSLGTLLPVLGVMWIFGILAIDERTVFFQYIFTIANSLQGFFIFLSHVLLNKKLVAGLRSCFLSSVYLKEKKEGVSEHRKISSTSSSSDSHLRDQKVKRESFMKKLSFFKENFPHKGEMSAKECSSFLDSKWESDVTYVENVKVNSTAAEEEKRYVATAVRLAMDGDRHVQPINKL